MMLFHPIRQIPVINLASRCNKFFRLFSYSDFTFSKIITLVGFEHCDFSDMVGLVVCYCAVGFFLFARRSVFGDDCTNSIHIFFGEFVNAGQQ